MNIRNMIVLVAALVIVVGIAGFFIGKAGYSVFSSPSGQSWVHAWIGDPVGLTAIATFALTIATLGAVLIALYGIRDERIRAKEEREEAQTRFERERNDFRAAQDETRRQFLASQQQTQDALEEGRRQFLEAQYAENRPLLVPIERRIEDIPTFINWNLPYEFIKLQNTGTGVATNIFGVFMPPEPVQSTYHQFHIDLGTPLPPGAKSSEDVMDTIFKKGGTVFNCDDRIGGHTLCVLEERSRGGRGDLIIARLTLTCSDIFGRKHASIFDYTDKNAWVNVAFIPNIEHDLGEMDEAKRIELSKDAKNPSSPDPT